MSEIIMEQITLEKANLIIQNSIKKAREIKINPIMVVVLDHRGAIKACLGEDGIVVYVLRLHMVKQMELSKWDGIKSII